MAEGQIHFFAALLKRNYFDLPFLNQVGVFFALIRDIDNSRFFFSDTLVESLHLAGDVDDPTLGVLKFERLFTDDQFIVFNDSLEVLDLYAFALMIHSHFF